MTPRVPLHTNCHRAGYRFIALIEGQVSVPTQQPVEMPRPAKSLTGGRPWRYLAAVLCAVLFALTVLVIWTAVSRTPPAPKVVRFTKLTSDGQRKVSTLVTDGVRIYFNESLPNGRDIIAQVSVKGGDVVPLSVPIKAPSVRDLSKDGTELLIASPEGTMKTQSGCSLSRVDRRFESGPLLLRMRPSARMERASSIARETMRIP